MQNNSYNSHAGSAFEVMDLSESSKAEHLSHMASMKLLEIQKRARSMIVPTIVDEVKNMLRRHREPVTLFGENHLDRRERLKRVLAEAEINRAEKGEGGSMGFDTAGTHSQTHENIASSVQREDVDDGTKKKVTATYTNCEEEMIAAREFLTSFSFDRAKKRIDKELSLLTDNDNNQRESNPTLSKSVAALQLNASAVSERPLMKVRFDPSGKYVATGSLGSHVKIWNVNSLQAQKTLSGHTERVTCVAWQPSAYEHFMEDSSPIKRVASMPNKKRKQNHSDVEVMEEEGDDALVNSDEKLSLLASASADGKCLIWDCKFRGTQYADSGDGSTSTSTSCDSISPILTLSGHVGALTQCAFHPSGKHIVTAGVDYSWRFWDLEKGKELLLQDGHPSECTSITPHPDGSLLLSADSSGYVFVWDLRSGKRILVLEGHADKVTASHIHPNGYEAATASLDNMIRIWDLRAQRCRYQLPAHSEAITDTRFSPSGSLLLSSSFDGSVNVWGASCASSGPYYPRLASLKGHTGKVMGFDIAPDELSVVSVGFDRTLKTWTC